MKERVLDIDEETKVGILTPRNILCGEPDVSIWNPYTQRITANDIERGLLKVVDADAYEKWFEIFEGRREVCEMERDNNGERGMDTVIAVKLVERGQSLERVYVHRDGSTSDAHSVAVEARITGRESVNADKPLSGNFEQTHMGD